LAGQSPELGKIRLHLPPGLVAVVGPDRRSMLAFVRLVRRRLPGLSGEPGDGAVDGEKSLGATPVGVSAEDVANLRVGTAELAVDPGDVLRVAAVTLARIGGVVRIDRAIAGLSRAEQERIEEIDRRDRSLSGTAAEGIEAAREELQSAERELRELRADHVELAGEVEAASMEWLRERQDAETNLQAYRDRARELKARLTQLEEAGRDAPCPTCRRVLGPHFDSVAAELREEWESVVQDGRWWKRRREQLDLKPQALREIEGRSLRLQAATERSAERVERARLRTKARERALGHLEHAEGTPDSGPSGEAAAALLEAMTRLRTELVGGARERILTRANRLLLRMSAGRLLGMGWNEADETVVLEGVDGRLDPGLADRAAAVVALRIGAAVALPESAEPGVLVVGEPFDDMDEETRLRTLGVLSDLGRRIPRILLVTTGGIVDLYPEVFDAVVELPTSGRSTPTVARALAGGIGVLRISP
jgi:hypothetical protein